MSTTAIMSASGTLYLAKMPPLANTASNGTFSVQMLAYDRQASHHVIPWRLFYFGDEATSWWAVNKPQLIPGARLAVQATQIELRSFAHCAPEIHARLTAAPILLPGRWTPVQALADGFTSAAEFDKTLKSIGVCM